MTIIVVRAMNKHRATPTLYITIPRDLAEELKIKEGTVFQAEAKGNKLVLRKLA